MAWRGGDGTEHKTGLPAFLGLGNERNSPALGIGEIRLPTNRSLLFFLVFIVLSPRLPFFDVGCAYPVNHDLSAPGLGAAHLHCLLRLLRMLP